jgi:hypothetical protein
VTDDKRSHEPEELETERREPEPTSAIARATTGPRTDLTAAPAPGVYALAAMSDAEFSNRLAALVKGRARVQETQRELMRDGVHYWKPPGSGEGRAPSLLKPGAEVLCLLYHLVADTKVEIEYGDPANVASPAIRVRARCQVHAGSIDGPTVGVGLGTANTWEIKYRYRNAARTCPSCQKSTIMRSKYPSKREEFLGQAVYWCNTKADGCGAEFLINDPQIVDQEVGRFANPDAYDLENTMVKMAEKRAKVDATIAATSSSDLFTQDIEDHNADDDEEKKSPAPARPATEAQVKFVYRLFHQKLNLQANADIARWLEKAQPEILWPVGPGQPLLTAPEASRLIEILKALPDQKPGNGHGPSSSSLAPAGRPAPEPGETAKRAAVIDAIFQLVATIEAQAAGRKILQKVGGLDVIVDRPTLLELGYREAAYPFDQLDEAELIKLGKFLRAQAEALAKPAVRS